MAMKCLSLVNGRPAEFHGDGWCDRGYVNRNYTFRITQSFNDALAHLAHSWSPSVFEVILVLAIMNGLHQDLAQKIIATKAHIIVSSTRPDRGIEK